MFELEKEGYGELIIGKSDRSVTGIGEHTQDGNNHEGALYCDIIWTK